MKILFISLSTYDQIGGIETFNQQFIEAMELNKFQYTVISFKDKFKKKNIYGCNSNVITFLYLLFLYRKKNDFIIWSHINLLKLFSLVNFLLKNKNILIIHGIDAWNKKNFLIKKSLSKINCVLSVSRYTKEAFAKLWGFDKTKIKILNNSIKLKNTFHNKNPYKKNSFNILTIMRLDNRKVQSVIDILDAMVKIDDPSVNFTIIGSGKERKLIEEEISTRKLYANVFIKGYVENTAPYLEHCDLFSLISDTEGFGIVYLEAMEYAKPCLAAKNCGSDEVIVDEFSGYQIEVNNILDLSDKIVKLKNDKNLRNKLGKNGKIILHKKFTFDSFIKRQKELLNISI